MRAIHVALLTTLAFALTAQAASPRAFDVFAGKWAGNLEYKDYQNPLRRVKIPVKLEVKPMDASTAIWDFKYDDFGKTVVSFETHSFNAGKYSVTTKGQAQMQTFTSSDFQALTISGSGKAVLSGTELEVGRKVDVRRTITLTSKTLITLTETRANGEPFAFRNRSTYTRQP